MNVVLQRYRRAWELLEQVAVAAAAETWDHRSPCPAWTARQLAGHLIDGQRQIQALLDGQGPVTPTVDPAALSQLAGQDPATAVCQAAVQVRSVLTGLDPVRVVQSGHGLLPVEQLLAMALIEPAVHGWDLAVATEQPATLDPDLTAALLPGVQQLGGQLAATGMYAHALSVADGASDTERLLAALGRKG